MGSRRTIRAYDYVERPYDSVRDALHDDALSIFQRATKAAEGRSEALVLALGVDLTGIEMSKDIEITIRGFDERKTSPECDLTRVTQVELEWQGSSAPGFFPAMTADLNIYPLSHTETQLELVGTYEPPMEVLGEALDAAVGHRIAEASVCRFVQAVAERLRADLA